MSRTSHSVGADRDMAARRKMPLWSVVALAVVGGLALGRFATAGGGGPSTPSTPDAPAYDPSLAPAAQVAALEATVEARPDDATSWRLLASAYGRRGAEVGDPAFYDLAQRAFARATELAPNDPTILVGRGALALTLHQFSEAEQLGEQAISALPANADALGVLVDAQVELGHYDDAAATLQRMLDARPGLPALARTSYLRELHGDLPAAKSAMRQAAVAGASPFDVATVTALLGDLERRSGDMAAAADLYGRAAEAAPSLVTAQVGATWVQAARGDRAGAIATLEGLVEDFPSPSLLLLLLDLQRSVDDHRGADETASLIRAIAVLQEDAGQVVDLEMALFEADEGTDPARAVALARRAQDARPDNVFVDDALAWALFKSGDVERASEYSQQALRLGSTEPLLRYHAAEIALANGKTDVAADHLEVALRDPWFSFQHHERALALASQLDLPSPSSPT